MLVPKILAMVVFYRTDMTLGAWDVSVNNANKNPGPRETSILVT